MTIVERKQKCQHINNINNIFNTICFKITFWSETDCHIIDGCNDGCSFVLAGTGRNIRHLPCVSRRSGETGVCMFAFTCAKANGTHLGTCIDRFYFGSCCKIDDVPYVFIQDNSIDDGPSPLRPFTTNRPIGSSISGYFTKPKPTDEKKPVEASQIMASR